MATEPILSVRDLTVAYPVRGFRRRPVTVVSDVSFDVLPGETLSLVGESGSGKTTIGRAILGLAPVTGGSISFQGHDITHATRKQRRAVAGGIQVVFQDPYSSLSPAMRIEDILAEPLRARGDRQARRVVSELLDAVGLPEDAGSRYAREFSGGQRQRIAIARALALQPDLIICDEPTSGLDKTTQVRVLELLRSIQKSRNVSLIFISHDLAVVRAMSDRIAVLQNGRIVEFGDVTQVSDNPRHRYTQMLQMASPVPDPVAQKARREQRLALLASEADAESA
jgi:ABC-type glutathione transport system ATPase component